MGIRRFFNLGKIRDFFIFRIKILDFVLLMSNITSAILLVFLANIKILTTKSFVIIIETSELLINASTQISSINEMNLLAKDHYVNVFLYLTAFFVIVVFLLSRHSPRKASIMFIYLAIRTPIHLLITASVLKFNTMGLWSAFTTIEAMFKYQVIFSKTYLNILIIIVSLLVFQGLILILSPKSFYILEKKSVFLSNGRINCWLKNMEILLPITFFVAGEGTLLIFYPLILLNKVSTYQPFITPIYLVFTSAIILIFLFLFNNIKEPVKYSGNETTSKNQANVILLVLFGFIWWLIFFFYGSLFLIEGQISLVLLWKLFYVTIIPFLLSYSIFYLVFYFKKRQKISKKQNIKEEHINEINDTKHVKKSRIKLRQVCSFILIIGILSSSIFTANQFIDIDNFFSFEEKFGLDMKVERECFVNQAMIYGNGSFYIKIEIKTNFTNVPIETQGSLIFIDTLVIDNDNDSFYDSYFFLHNVSIVNIVNIIMINIGTNQNGNTIGINGVGRSDILGNINATFTIGEQITFIFANYYTDDKFSIVFNPYSTIIL